MSAKSEMPSTAGIVGRMTVGLEVGSVNINSNGPCGEAIKRDKDEDVEGEGEGAKPSELTEGAEGEERSLIG